MKYAAYLLTMVFILSPGAAEGVTSPISVDVKEGKSVYAPVNPPINLFEEARLQEHDQNATRRGGQK
ncbi:MAG: hypothetical protein M0P91_00125 [Sulfuricurvum sp.]|jgi:hypothetical protein|uniref:hypothetical protein n=1 Tax=Sulfuricurvum sp. TaxID=2025608 RepID=UPI0025CD9E8B|nr:hypothetical protein [Sulfuricurvum sp.]MCK9371580.1 hypothetical protein [Sulfuricurvum sp.]